MNDSRHRIVLLNALCGLVYLLHAGYFAGLVPIATGKVSVLIVEETSDREKLTAGQREIIESNAADSLKAWLTTHGEADSLRVIDKDNSPARDASKWQALWKLPRESVPWLIVARNGHALFSGPLPADAAATWKIFHRYGGK